MPDYTAFCHTCQRYLRRYSKNRHLAAEAAEDHTQKNPTHEVTVQKGA